MEQLYKINLLNTNNYNFSGFMLSNKYIYYNIYLKIGLIPTLKKILTLINLIYL